jgi:hypothetical protein
MCLNSVLYAVMCARLIGLAEEVIAEEIDGSGERDLQN